jgi:hypothetical protein
MIGPLSAGWRSAMCSAARPSRVVDGFAGAHARDPARQIGGLPERLQQAMVSGVTRCLE